jgi:putative membrane protein
MPYFHHGAAGSFGPAMVTATLVFTALVYLRGWASLRSSCFNYIRAWRAGSFLLGLFLIWVAIESPIGGLDHELLTVHMLQHLLLMTLAPPLIWLGEPAVAWSQGMPRFVRRALGAGPAKLTTGNALVRPEICWLAAATALIVWHIPAVFTLAMQSAAWHFVEQSSFLATGLLFWWPVVQPRANVGSPELSMILYLFFATLPCDILSGFLVFCDRVVYPVYLSASHAFGFSALGDQQCAAALMWTCVTIVYLVAGAILTMRLLSPQVHSRVGLVPLKLRDSGIARKVSHGLEAL